jgi:HAD superfamily hydrolase (TIGR01509 family)
MPSWKNHMQYEAILFDFDGVLIDSEPLHFACWRELARPLGVEIGWDTYNTRLRGHSGDALIETMRHLADPPVPFDAMRSIYPAKNDLFRQRALETGVMSADVKHLLGGLNGYRLAIVSSARRSHLGPILHRAGMDGRFDTIVCREDVRAVKPSPEPYHTAAARLGVKRALVVEDSEAGVRSGEAAGFDVLYVPEYAQMPALLRQRLGI